MCPRLILSTLAVLVFGSTQAFDLAEYRIVDLSHVYGEDTLYWPTLPTRFEKRELAFGETEEGYFYSSFSICTPEHGGTHLDAPLHFTRGGLSTEQIPLESLISPAVVIDISEQTNANRNYRLTIADIEAFEEDYGQIAAGSIVLIRTNWSRHWPDAKAYLGDDTMGDASNLQFPGFGADATRLLTEGRKVALIGIDTASIDYGKSKDFVAHQISAAQGVANLENLTNLSALPATGSLVMALPMKIEGGSGAPVRVVALVPRLP